MVYHHQPGRRSPLGSTAAVRDIAMSTVFVSHSSDDHEVVYPRIVVPLESSGIDTFYSRDSIHGAEEWEKRIREGLASCDWFLVALTENSVCSEWVQAEVGWALANRRGRVVPVLLGDCRPENCNLRLAQIQYVDLRDNDPGEQKELLSILSKPAAAADETGAAAIRVESTPRGARPSVAWFEENRRLLLLAASLLLAAGLIYGLSRLFDGGADDRPQTPPQDKPIVAADNVDAKPPPVEHPAPAPDVVIAVDLAQHVELPEPAEIAAAGNPVDDPFRVTYEYEHRDDVLAVDYAMPYLKRVRDGGPIRGVRARPYDWEFPKLSIKVLNNSPRTVMITRCMVEVRQSTLNTEPLISVAEESFNCLIFLNDGWGDVIDPVVVFKMKSPRSDGEDLLFAAELHTLEFATFDATAKLPIGKYVPDHLAEFSHVVVDGVLQYGPADDRKKLPFATLVNLESYPGDPSPPTHQYDIALKAGEAPKAFPVSISQEIKAGDTDHFLLRIGSDKSAAYELTLTFISAEGRELGRQKVSLNVFVPRMAATNVEQADKLESPESAEPPAT